MEANHVILLHPHHKQAVVRIYTTIFSGGSYRLRKYNMTSYGTTDRTYDEDEVESHDLLPLIDPNPITIKSAPAKRIWSLVLSSIMGAIVLTTMLAFMTSSKKNYGSEINSATNIE